MTKFLQTASLLSVFRNNGVTSYFHSNRYYQQIDANMSYGCGAIKLQKKTKVRRNFLSTTHLVVMTLIRYKRWMQYRKN